MRISTEDYAKNVDVGTGSIWYSLYSTVMVRINETIREKTIEAISFLKNGECSSEAVPKVLKQMKKLQKALGEINPEGAVFDLKNPSKSVPWKGHISSEVTSCANLYTTADGKDLLTEVISLLEYAQKANVAVTVE